MATRATIAVIADDGSIKSIYCHYDGDLKATGKNLLNNYNTKDKAAELLSLGSLSNLGDSIDTSVFYCRDMGEDGIYCKSYDSFLEYRMFEDFQEFNYIFQDGKWNIYYPESKRMELLEDVFKS